MSAGNFQASLSLTLVYEGGFCDNPKDPGGATYLGVTQKVYDEFRDAWCRPRQSVSHIGDAELNMLYATRYWQRVNADQLALGLDYAVFDFAVNSGVGRAARTLQGIVGVTADGEIGPKTLQALSVHAGTYGVTALTDALCNARMTFLRSLPTFATFGNGWTRRVMGAQAGHQPGDTGVIDRAYDMAAGNRIAMPTSVVITAKTYNAKSLGVAA